MSLGLIILLTVILSLSFVLLIVIIRRCKRYNNANNPCFHGSCTVRLIDGSIKFVKDVRRGDRLFPHGETVNYVVRTVCTNGKADMVLVCSICILYSKETSLISLVLCV
jgi:hypothetical protein